MLTGTVRDFRKGATSLAKEARSIVGDQLDRGSAGVVGPGRMDLLGRLQALSVSGMLGQCGC
jgi:hypothetical protein